MTDAREEFARLHPEAWAAAEAMAAGDRALLARLVAEGKVMRVPGGVRLSLGPAKPVRGADTIVPKGKRRRR